MPSYKLIYGNARGRAEICRLIFAQAEVKYEDCRLVNDEWPKLKPSTPTGMLPILEVDGKPLTGSGPMARFLAERFGLAGSNDFENAQLAGIIDVMADFMVKLVDLYHTKDEEQQVAMKKKLEEEAIPKYWGVLEKMLQKNSSGWMFGEKLTYADLCIADGLDHMARIFPNFFDSYPELGKLKAKVEALPNIAKWIKERPKTDH